MGGCPTLFQGYLGEWTASGAEKAVHSLTVYQPAVSCGREVGKVGLGFCCCR